MKNLITILVIVSSCASYAQEDIFFEDSSTAILNDTPQDISKFTYNAFREKVHFRQMEKNWKVTPFDFVNIYPMLSVDLETKMKPGLSFQYGIGFIPDFLQIVASNRLLESAYDWMYGYRLRFESRWFGFKKPEVYVSGEISFRHLIIQEETIFGFECENPFGGNCAYQMKQEMLYNRFSTHFNIKTGWQKIQRNGLIVDYYAGLSFRRNNVISNSPVPEGGSSNFTPLWQTNTGWILEDGHKFGFVTPIIGVRIGWHVPAKRNI